MGPIKVGVAPTRSVEMMARFGTKRLVTLFLTFAMSTSCAAASKISVEEQKSKFDQLRVEHITILNGMNAKDATGKPLDLDDPKVSELLKRGWRLAGDWAATYFEAHPSPSQLELSKVFDGFTPKPHGVKSQYGDFLEYPEYSFTGSAVRIAASVFVVQAQYFRDTETGAFMVIARNHNGQFKAAWSIKERAYEHFAGGDEIGRWAFLVRRAYYNGPLNVRSVLRLPPETNGHARFLVDAYQSADGGTHLAQLSIWEWDGVEANPLIIKTYEYAADYGGLRVVGSLVRVSTKEELETFFSCGMCPDPRGTWTIQITPNGVHDLGHRFKEPEFQWADELLSKVENGEDTTGIADADVVAALKKEALDEQTQNPPSNPSEKEKFSWGMLSDCRVLSRGVHGAFLLSLDEASLRFSYELRNGRPYFTKVLIQ